MRTGLFIADRTAVLFLGIAAGAAIGYAFAAGRDQPPPRPASPPATAAPAAAAAASMRSDIAEECALPFQPHLLEAVAAGRPVTVAVFGDSFGDGVWSALYRLLPERERFRVLKYSQQSTGFTRYASLNLEDHARAQIDAAGGVDIAVISFGANDTQGVYAGGHAAALMSPEWQRLIGGRVDAFVRLMRARGAAVYWLGLPKMRAAAFDADIAAMNAFYERRMKALRVPFIDIRPLTMDEGGEYAPYLPDPISHEKRLIRANDGIHMSMNGYVVVTRALAERIKAYVAAARVMAGEVPALPPLARPAKPPQTKPPEAKPPQAKPKLPVRRPEPAPPKPAEKQPEPKLEPKPEPKPEPKSEPKPEPQPPAKPRAEPPPPPLKPKAEPSPPPARPKVEAPPPAKPRTEPQAPAKPKAEPQPPAKPKAEPQPAVRPKVEPQPAAKPKAEAPAATKPRIEPKPDAKPKPAPDKVPDKVPDKAPPKDAADPAARPPLRLNLPPPEAAARKPATPAPATDQP